LRQIHPNRVIGPRFGVGGIQEAFGIQINIGRIDRVAVLRRLRQGIRLILVVIQVLVVQVRGDVADYRCFILKIVFE
jgi:hypothetical protein